MTIDDVKNGGNGGTGSGSSSTTGGGASTNTNAGNGASTTTPTSIGGNVGEGGGTSVSSNGGGSDPNKGVVGNGESSTAQQHNTTDATDPTQAAINLVKQKREEAARQQQTQPQGQTQGDDAAANNFLNYYRQQNGGTPPQSQEFTPSVQQQAGGASNGTSSSPASSGAAVDTGAQDTDGQPKKEMSYVDLFQAMNPYQMPTKEEIEKERRKEKRERLFASISDAISAMSNLYFTTKYAPNMYNPVNSQYAGVDDRWTRLRKDRDENIRRYMDGYLKAAQADDLRKIRQQNADTTAAKAKADAERKDAITKVQIEGLEARKRKDNATADQAELTVEYLKLGYPYKLAKLKAEADYATFKANNAPQEAKDKHQLAQATVGQRNASATNSYASANRKANGGSGTSGGGKGKYYGTFLGKNYQTKADYDKAVMDYAKANGIPTTEQSGGIKTKSGYVGGSLRNRPISTIAAEGEKHHAQTHPKPRNRGGHSGGGNRGGGSNGGKGGKGGNSGGNWASGLKL